MIFVLVGLLLVYLPIMGNLHFYFLWQNRLIFKKISTKHIMDK